MQLFVLSVKSKSDSFLSLFWGKWEILCLKHGRDLKEHGSVYQKWSFLLGVGSGNDGRFKGDDLEEASWVPAQYCRVPLHTLTQAF